MGFRIFALCLRQLFINWLVAIRLSWFWILVMLLSFGLIAVVADRFTQAAASGELAGGSLFFLLIFLMVFAVIFVAFATIAIGWHRWVLRDEEPDRFYVLRGDWSLGAYILRSLLIGLITLLIIGPVYLIFMMSFAGSIVGTDGGALLTPGFMAKFLAVSLIVGTFATWIVLRIGLVLPAIAVGERLSIGDSFRATSRISGALVVTALCVVLFQSIPSILDLVATVLTGGFASALGTIATVINLFFSWMSFFVSFGILTVVYGHVVENRPI